MRRSTLSVKVSLLVWLKRKYISNVVPPTVLTMSGGASGAGGALPPSVMGRGKVLPSLLVLPLTSGAGVVVLVIVVLGSLVIGSPFIVHQS